jgi:hypothetical protein
MTEETINFEDSGIVEQLEDDRFPLKGGEVFIIRDILFKPHQKFKEICKINGEDEKGMSVKFFTTSAVITDMCHKISDQYGDRDGKIHPGIRVHVLKKKSGETKNSYLTFAGLDKS